MAQTRDWKLVLNCPRCARASQIAVANLGAVVRCPHCRTNAVIERDGIHEARKPKHRGRRQASQSQPQSKAKSRAKRTGQDLPRKGNLGYGLVCTASVFVLFAAGMATFFSWSWRPPPDNERALLSAAKLFYSAWLDEDLDTAATFVLSNDRARLEQWSAPRRAGLVAGFGPEFRGRVTGVEILRNDANQAVVRVAFEIRGRKQQTFQDWKLVDCHWCLSLD